MEFFQPEGTLFNCTLTTLELSHTDGLIEISVAIMEKVGVCAEVLRPIDFNIAYGVYPDMKDQAARKTISPGEIQRL